MNCCSLDSSALRLFGDEGGDGGGDGDGDGAGDGDDDGDGEYFVVVKSPLSALRG